MDCGMRVWDTGCHMPGQVKIRGLHSLPARTLHAGLTCLWEEGQRCLEYSDRAPEVGLKDQLHLPHVRVGGVACARQLRMTTRCEDNAR